MVSSSCLTIRHWPAHYLLLRSTSDRFSSWCSLLAAVRARPAAFAQRPGARQPDMRALPALRQGDDARVEGGKLAVGALQAASEHPRFVRLLAGMVPNHVGRTGTGFRCQ